MIIPYYIYTRAGGEGKEEGRTGRERGAMESRRKEKKKRGRGIARRDCKGGRREDNT